MLLVRLGFERTTASVLGVLSHLICLLNNCLWGSHLLYLEDPQPAYGEFCPCREELRPAYSHGSDPGRSATQA